MNKNSNTYQIVYAAIMVVVVGAALAWIYMTLKPQQDQNRDNDTRSQILSALRITPDGEGQVIEDAFKKYIVGQYLVNTDGQVTDKSANVAFNVGMKNNVKLAAGERKLPVFVAKLDDGSTKYVIPCYGAGLWGPIWGYVAVDADGQTIYGANFSHESETPGLGARIAEQPFQDEFKGKKLYVAGAFKGVAVMKKGQKSTDGAEQVDALSGATITSRGVGSMLKNCLAPYDKFLQGLQAGNTNPNK